MTIFSYVTPDHEVATKELIFHRLLLPAIERSAASIAVVDEANGHVATFDAHAARVFRLASAMHTHLGLSGQDRFAIVAANSHAYLELWHAGFMGAGVVTPLNVRLTPGELTDMLVDSGARVCFTDRQSAMIIDSIRGATCIEHVVLIDGGDLPGEVGYEELLTAGEPVVPPEPEEDDPVALMYTAGTTGTAKGVLLSQRAEMLALHHVAMALPPLAGGVHLNQAALFHGSAMGAVLTSPAFGNTVVLLPSFDVATVLDAIERHRVTGTGMAPAMIKLLIEHESFHRDRLASLRRLAYGASTMSRPLLERLLDTFPDVEFVQGYGMTESASIITALMPADHRRRGDVLSSAGRALPGVQLRIEDADGNRAGAGTVGEVCARGGNFMLGYLNRPEETAQVFRGGWYHTGDMGYLDVDGYLFLVDRVDDMIITGGENVYPSEVERGLATHPAVTEVAVVGVHDEKWGQAVVAFVVAAQDSELTEQDILEHARQELADFKVPKAVEIRHDPLPRSAAMKVLKRELRLSNRDDS